MSFKSSSSSSDDFQLQMAQIDEQEDAICHQIIQNNITIMQILNEYAADQTIERNVGGSIPGHAFINQDRESVDRRLFNDYFSESPMYNEAMFRRRYRMSRSLFLRIMYAVKSHDNYFVQQADRAGRFELSPLQKITAVFCWPTVFRQMAKASTAK